MRVSGYEGQSLTPLFTEGGVEHEDGGSIQHHGEDEEENEWYQHWSHPEPHC